MTTLDLTAQKLNVKVPRGASIAVTLTLTEDDAVTPIDLTGLTFTAAVYLTDDPDAAVEFEFDNEVTDAENGEIVVTFLVPDDFADSSFWSLWSDSGGAWYPWASGTLTAKGPGNPD